VIFYRIICTPFKEFGNFSPFIAYPFVVKEENPLFLLTPAYLFDLRIQVIMPALPALLPDATREMLSDLSPLLRSMQMNQLNHESILLFSPWTLDQTRVEDFLPPVKTLNICATRKDFSYLFPIFASMLEDSISQH
jgi:hypothetical protein